MGKKIFKLLIVVGILAGAAFIVRKFLGGGGADTSFSAGEPWPPLGSEASEPVSAATETVADTAKEAEEAVVEAAESIVEAAGEAADEATE